MKKVAAAISAVLLAAASLAGCSADHPAPGQADAVLLDTGTVDGVGWALWAWEDNGQLCMGVGNQSAPASTRNPATGGMAGSQCGFNGKKQGVTFYGSAANGTNGPPTVALLFGPAPNAAVAVQVTSKITLKTQAFPTGADLPDARYWYWAAAYSPPASDGTLLPIPRPLDAKGKAVAFQAY